MDNVNYEEWERIYPVSSLEFLNEVFGHGCAIPGCTHQHSDEEMYFHASCHVEAGIQAAYYHGSIYLSCGKCGRFVVRIKPSMAAETMVM